MTARSDIAALRSMTYEQRAALVDVVDIAVEVTKRTYELAFGVSAIVAPGFDLEWLPDLAVDAVLESLDTAIGGQP